MTAALGPAPVARVVPERLVHAMAEAEVDQTMLANRVGVTPGAINQLANGRTAKSRFLPEIARELGVSVDWLTGKSDDSHKDALSAEMIADQLDAVLLPEVEVSYSMGGGNVIEDWPVVRQVPFSRSWLRGFTTSSPEHLAVARGEGDSMMPTILDGDLVILDLSDRTIRQQDRIYALSYGGLGMIKRVRALPDGSYQINSDNPAVTPILAAEGEMYTVARVCGVVRRI